MKLYIFSSFGDRISREEKEVVELSTEERLRRLQKYLNERYGK